MTKEVWKKVIKGVLQIIQIVTNAILQKWENEEEMKRNITLLYEKE